PRPPPSTAGSIITGRPPQQHARREWVWDVPRPFLMRETRNVNHTSRFRPRRHTLAKKIRAIVKVQVQGGKASPAPPVGPALGGHGINIMQFVKEYNERTADQVGFIIPAEITVFEDRSFTFVTKTPPAADLLRKAARVE